MKIVEVQTLAIPEVKVITVEKFRDARGYFLEHYRESDAAAAAPFLAGQRFVQGNGSFSRAGTVRGMHFQWSPPVGKLVRTVVGHMIDLVLDVRAESPTFGHIIAFEMPSREATAELIWIPPGLAHGNTFLADTYIEYLCTGEYNAAGEGAVSPLADDIDWSLCDERLRRLVRSALDDAPVMSPRDREAPGVGAWSRELR